MYWHFNPENLSKYWNRVYKTQLDAVKARLEAGMQNDCFAVEFLKATDDEVFNETQQLFTLSTLMEAGSDTSFVSIGQMIAGATTYLNRVERARAQLNWKPFAVKMEND